jgi:hypothetical protein
MYNTGLVLDESEMECEGDQHDRYAMGAYLGRIGTVAASKRAPEHFLPQIGDIILYNENTKQQVSDGGGCWARTPRGVARVIGFSGQNNCLIQLQVYRMPQLKKVENFLCRDFRIGLYRYRKMTDYVYTVGRYSFDELSLDHPHEDLIRLFADDGNYVVPEEMSIYLGAVR